MWDGDFFFAYYTEMEIAPHPTFLLSKKENSSSAHSIPGEINYLHEGNKCQ